MTEPIEEIVTRWEATDEQEVVLMSRVDLMRLIASWRERGEALKWYATDDNKWWVVDKNGERIVSFGSFGGRARAALAT